MLLYAQGGQHLSTAHDRGGAIACARSVARVREVARDKNVTRLTAQGALSPGRRRWGLLVQGTWCDLQRMSAIGAEDRPRTGCVESANLNRRKPWPLCSSFSARGREIICRASDGAPVRRLCYRVHCACIHMGVHVV